MNLLQVGVTTFALWRCLSGSGHAGRFDPGITRGIWRFAAGMSGITITALMLTQLDKVILSKMLSLKTFGYYILAGMIGNGLSGLLISPMFNTIFPRFSALVAEENEKSLLEMYHGSTQVMAVMILPAAADAVVLPFRDGGGEWNSSIHSATVQETFVLTNSREEKGYDENSNIYYALPSDIPNMQRVLRQYAGRRRRSPLEVQGANWDTIASAHMELYHNLLKGKG